MNVDQPTEYLHHWYNTGNFLLFEVFFNFFLSLLEHKMIPSWSHRDGERSTGLFKYLGTKSEKIGYDSKYAASSSSLGKRQHELSS